METNEKRIFTCTYCKTKNRIEVKTALEQLDKINCGGCHKPLFLPDGAPLMSLSVGAYQHELDVKARRTLQRVPGVHSLIRFLTAELSERRMRMYFQQANVRVTPTHLTPLFDMIEKATDVLDLGSVPDLFVQNDPHPNAFCIGVEQPFVVVTTALLDLLNEKEILGVIAHELGHVHAGHQLYRTALYLIVNLADMTVGSMIPLRDAALQAIYYALLYWTRCGELTADRAQMIVSRDFESFVTCEMRLASGCRYTNDMLDVQAFLVQAREAAAMREENLMNKIYSSIQTAEVTHPYPVWRVGHMYDWVHEGNFLNIMAGDYETNVPKEPAEELEPTTEETPGGVKSFIESLRKTMGV